MPQRTMTAEAQGNGWDDGLIARRALIDDAPPGRSTELATAVPAPAHGAEAPEDRALHTRLGALRELIGLSRARLEAGVLAEAGKVLDEAAARDRLPRTYTTVAIAGATGSGKSTLFNAMAGANLSETGVRRPTTANAVACSWPAGKGRGGDGLLERLAIPVRARRRAHVPDPALRGLILLDLPDHDSIAPDHREQVDRLLGLVDAVIWVVDPEKYADAVFHERYLRAFAGHAEVSIVVLNQADRLPGDAVDAVLDDLRRLLDERGIALSEHGEPGAGVLAVSALTGQGVPELRQLVGDLVGGRSAAAKRIAADVDGVARRLRPLYVGEEAESPAGLTQRTREDFEERLALAVGAQAAGQAAERGWLRRADRACGTPWAQLARRMAFRQAQRRGEPPALLARRLAGDPPPAVSRPALEQAVRELAEDASHGLPLPWSTAVHDAAWRGAQGLPRALETALARPPAREDGDMSTSRQKKKGTAEGNPGTQGTEEKTRPEKPGRTVAAAGRGRRWFARHRQPELTVLKPPPGTVPAPPVPTGPAAPALQLPRPGWWSVAAFGQAMLLAAQLLGVSWLLAALIGFPVAGRWLPLALLLGGSVGGPLLAWTCRLAARGPAHSWGRKEEWRLRRLAAEAGQSHVLEPVAAELLRYREVREQYAIAASPTGSADDPIPPAVLSES
ncbi:GTPase [Streptomyces harbinensis]|uniref:GTPase n=1 Tax=Streptomyces harbinensis TaxID=1176198 RepID=UPI003723BCE1